jgi:Protein of unknown function (DUF1153)
MPTYTNAPPEEPAAHLTKTFPLDVKKNGSWGKSKKFDIVWSVKNGARKLEDVLKRFEMDISEYNSWVKRYNAEVYNALTPKHPHPDQRVKRAA